MSERTEGRRWTRAGDRPTPRLAGALPALVTGALADRDAPSGVTGLWPATGLLAVVTAEVVLRVVNNLPGAMPPPLAAGHGWLGTAGPSLVAGLAVLVGVTRRAAWPRVGLVVAGVFGLLGLHVPAASLPATVAVAGAPVLAVLDRLRAPGSSRRTVVAFVVWLGLGLSLGSATGLLPGGRALGSAMALVGIALLPIALGSGRRAWATGVLAAAGGLWFATALPFVAGAVLLVAFGVVGVPPALVAAASGGGVAAFAGSIPARGPLVRWSTPVAIGLLLVAGVPATIPRALAAGVGLALLLEGGPG